jgi:hypothetical protein
MGYSQCLQAIKRTLVQKKVATIKTLSAWRYLLARSRGTEARSEEAKPLTPHAQETKASGRAWDLMGDLFPVQKKMKLKVLWQG